MTASLQWEVSDTIREILRFEHLRNQFKVTNGFPDSDRLHVRVDNT